MAVKFITFLGTTSYAECYYELNGNQSSLTPYIQKALIELLEKDNLRVDEFHILLTPQSRDGNWEGPGKLKEALKELPIDLKLIEHEISGEQSYENVWNLFETMISILDEQDTVIFDITHSFRFQPMLALLAIHFARVIKDLRVEGIYYGTFYGKGERSPVLDLTSFVELQDWITNVYTLTKTGRADLLTEWLREKDQSIRRRERRGTIDLTRIRELARNWHELTTALETNRSLSLQEKATGVLNSIHSLKQVMLRPVFSPLNALLSDLEETIKPMTEDDLILRGLSAIEWCANHGLFQQAYTMANELIITAVCIKNGYDIQNYDERKKGDNLLKVAVFIKRGEGDNDYEKLEEKEKQAVDELLSYPILLDVVDLLIDYRNDINHAGMRKKPKNGSDFKSNYEKWFPNLRIELLKYR